MRTKLAEVRRIHAPGTQLVTEHAHGAHMRRTEFALGLRHMLQAILAHQPAELIDVDDPFLGVAQGRGRSIPFRLDEKWHGHENS